MTCRVWHVTSGVLLGVYLCVTSVSTTVAVRGLQTPFPTPSVVPGPAPSRRGGSGAQWPVSGHGRDAAASTPRCRSWPHRGGTAGPGWNITSHLSLSSLAVTSTYKWPLYRPPTSLVTSLGSYRRGQIEVVSGRETPTGGHYMDTGAVVICCTWRRHLSACVTYVTTLIYCHCYVTELTSEVDRRQRQSVTETLTLVGRVEVEWRPSSSGGPRLPWSPRCWTGCSN